MLRLSTFEEKEKEKRREREREGERLRKGGKKTLGVKRIEKECRIASPFRARPPLLQREVITEFMKGRIYRKKLLRTRRKKKEEEQTRKTWRPLSFLPLLYPATFPIINPHKCCITPKINRIIQPILTNISPPCLVWPIVTRTIFRREREERRN